MVDCRLKATLRAYVNGVFPTKVSELDNDVPFLETTYQELTEEQQRQLLKNQNASAILAENFVRYDVATKLTEDEKRRARDNINALSTYSINAELKDLEDKMQLSINTEAKLRSVADNKINEYLDTNNELIGFVSANTVTSALNELAARVSLPETDGTTIIRKTEDSGDVLRVIAIKDVLNDGTEKRVTPQDIKEIENRVSKNENEIERIAVRGGYITRYDFGWDGGTLLSLAVGEKFQEQNPTAPTKKRTISIVSNGGDYPNGTKINASDAREKAFRFQIDLTAWAAEDVWGESFSRYGDDLFPFVLAKDKAITLRIGKGINSNLPIGYWESIGTDSDWNEYGLWVSDAGDGRPKVNIGRFVPCDEEISGTDVWTSFETIDEWSTDLINYWHNDEIDADITLHDIVRKEFETEENNEPLMSGINWSETFLYWKGHSPIELFNGTRCINSFDGWVWEISNIRTTGQTVFEWNLADVGAEFGFAKYDTGGVVKVSPTREEISGAVYGVLLDDNNRMFVDRLGTDMKLKANTADILAAENARDDSIRELYNTLVGEGWIKTAV